MSSNLPSLFLVWRETTPGNFYFVRDIWVHSWVLDWNLPFVCGTSGLYFRVVCPCVRVALSVVTSRIPLFVICAQNALNKFVWILMGDLDPYLTLSRSRDALWYRECVYEYSCVHGFFCILYWFWRCVYFCLSICERVVQEETFFSSHFSSGAAAQQDSFVQKNESRMIFHLDCNFFHCACALVKSISFLLL